MSAVCYSPWALWLWSLGAGDPVCRVLLAFEVQPTWGTMSAWDYLLRFALTWLLEYPIYLIAQRRAQGSWRALSVLGWNGVLNVATHPLVCFMFPSILHRMHASVGQTITLSEAFAVIVEAWIFQRLARVSESQALRTALAANLFSWGLGAFLLS